jgi:hypothetical protein
MLNCSSQLHVTLSRQTVLAYVPRVVMTGSIESTGGKYDCLCHPPMCAISYTISQPGT